MNARWRNRLLDAGLVAFFLALPAAALTGSSWVGLGLLTFFMLSAVPTMFRPWRRR